MKPFRFRLDPVARLRANEERTRRVTLALEFNAMAQMDEQRDRLIGELAATDAAIANPQHPSALEAAVHAYRFGSERLRALDAARSRQQERIDVAREALAEARKRSQVLVRLEEKARDAYRAEMFAAEQALLDESALARLAVAR